MKAGLVEGPLRRSVCLSVRSSVDLSATRLGYLECVICNSNSLHSFIFKLCLMIVYTLKMCTFDKYYLIFTGVELRRCFFSFEMRRGVRFV